MGSFIIGLFYHDIVREHLITRLFNFLDRNILTKKSASFNRKETMFSIKDNFDDNSEVSINLSMPNFLDIITEREQSSNKSRVSAK